MTPPEVPIELAVRREVLRMALHNSGRSVPLLLVAVALCSWLGVEVGSSWAALAAGVVGIAVAAMRFWITSRYAERPGLSERQLLLAEREIEINSILAGSMWILYTVWVYPRLTGHTSIVYVVIVCGSVAVAVVFMSLLGRAFNILACMQIGALTIVSLAVEQARSWPVAALTAVFGITMYRAAREFRDVATLAIQHGLVAEAAKASLVHARDAAEAANRAKSSFLATMTHEIRTPMTGVLGALELLRMSPLDPGQRRLLKAATSSGRSLMAILNDVLDLSKIEAGRLTLTSGTLSIERLSASVVALFRATAESKGLSLELDLADHVADRVIGDSQRLKQVLLNLVGNAIKFTEQGGVTLRVESARSTDGRAAITFEVVDTGVGMSAEVVDRLFQPFEQGDGARRLGGSGLGLAISQHLVQAMGGSISVASEPGRGSRFKVVLALPYDPDITTPIVSDSAMVDLDGGPSFAATALLVEDNPVNRMLATEMLRALGVTVVEAEDGRQAIEQWSAHRVDIVLMDCELPVIDGYAATQRIRALETQRGLPRMPIIAMTASAFGEDERHAREAGMDGHLSKPYTFEQLRDTLATWL